MRRPQTAANKNKNNFNTALRDDKKPVPGANVKSRQQTYEL